VAVRAQQAAKTIGLLGAVSASQQSPWTAAFLQRLHGIRDYVEVGGLMSYAASLPDLWWRANRELD